MENELSKFIKHYERIIEDIKSRSYDKSKVKILATRFDTDFDMQLKHNVKNNENIFKLSRLKTEFTNAMTITLSNYEAEKRNFWTKIISSISNMFRLRGNLPNT